MAASWEWIVCHIVCDPERYWLILFLFGFAGIPPTQGPLGHSIRDLELYMRVVLAAEPWRRDPRFVIARLPRFQSY